MSGEGSGGRIVWAALAAGGRVVVAATRWVTWGEGDGKSARWAAWEDRQGERAMWAAHPSSLPSHPFPSLSTFGEVGASGSLGCFETWGSLGEEV
jgi:hypothetical protein